MAASENENMRKHSAAVNLKKNIESHQNFNGSYKKFWMV